MGGLYNSVAWGQQTLAARMLASQASGRRGGLRSARKRRKARAQVRGAVKRRKPARSRTKARMVKGSAAARRHMAKLRRMRKRR